MIDWGRIQTVLLDMDGTLLDLHFDNHFWRVHMPRRYAQERGITVQAAEKVLFDHYQAVEGTMDWYCLDYWSSKLGMDVAMLKREVDHLIAIHPHVEDFLAAVRNSGRRAVLVTNAHMKSLSLKMEHTRLAGHFDALICAHDIGLPKENPDFWAKLQTVEPFEPTTTLLVDDNLSVLRSARSYQLNRLLCVRRPDSQAPEKDVEEFDAINSFAEIMPTASLQPAIS